MYGPVLSGSIPSECHYICMIQYTHNTHARNTFYKLEVWRVNEKNKFEKCVCVSFMNANTVSQLNGTVEPALSRGCGSLLHGNNCKWI